MLNLHENCTNWSCVGLMSVYNQEYYQTLLISQVITQTILMCFSLLI